MTTVFLKVSQNTEITNLCSWFLNLKRGERGSKTLTEVDGERFCWKQLYSATFNQEIRSVWDIWEFIVKQTNCSSGRWLTSSSFYLHRSLSLNYLVLQKKENQCSKHFTANLNCRGFQTEMSCGPLPSHASVQVAQNNNNKHFQCQVALYFFTSIV